jgi:hypothetical protein
MPDIELTKEEKNAITSLKRLAKKWPVSLWLFSASGTLSVMRTGENGEFVLGTGWASETFDQEYYVDDIDIPNDGGDF